MDLHMPGLRFFLLQGLGLVAERLCTQLTGKKVDGTLGRLWTLFALALPASELPRAWSVSIHSVCFTMET